MPTDLPTARAAAAESDSSEPLEGRPGQQRLQRQRRRAWLLLAAFAWNTWVWSTRIYLMLTGGELATRSTGFVVVHLVLYTASLAVGLVVGVIGWHMWRESRGGSTRTAPADPDDWPA